MSDTSAILSLPYIQPAQAQKHLTHNEALRHLDLLVQLTVTDRGRSDPPAAPEDGARHIVGTGAIGEWAGQDEALAVHAVLNGWQFVTPPCPAGAPGCWTRRGWWSGTAAPGPRPPRRIRSPFWASTRRPIPPTVWPSQPLPRC